MTSPRARRLAPSLLLLALLALAGAAQAQAPAGTVAALQGRAEAQRGGEQTWRALAPGTDVFVGDRLRTAEASRLKVLMRDDSVITLGPKSELVVDRLVVGATSTSRMDQVVGTVRAVVTDRYGSRGSSFEVKTPTAVAGVRGTGFVSLADADGKRTRVVGLYDMTWVRGVADTRGEFEVGVGPGQMTEVLAGQQPSKPRDLSASELDALVGPTEMVPGPPAADRPGEPAAEDTDAADEEGSGDQYDPATPGPPGGGSFNRPDGVIDQPLDRLRERSGLPPPPPPNR